jgi:hypothetical protein
VFVLPLAILLSVLRIGIFKVFFIEKHVDILNVYTINVITLSKPCTQILTRAISNIVKLYAWQVLSIKVMTSNICWILLGKIPILRTDNKMAKGRTNTDLYSIAQKTNDRATRTLLKSYEGELRCCG